MKRFTLMACAGLLAAAMAVPSLAADLPRPAYKAPVFVAPFSWSGFYVGINGGYAWGNADVSNALGSFTTNGTNGGLVGATLGYNLQTGNWVWGVEADFDYACIKGNVSNTVAACPGLHGQEYLARHRARPYRLFLRSLAALLHRRRRFRRRQDYYATRQQHRHRRLGWTARCRHRIRLPRRLVGQAGISLRRSWQIDLRRHNLRHRNRRRTQDQHGPRRCELPLLSRTGAERSASSRHDCLGPAPISGLPGIGTGPWLFLAPLVLGRVGLCPEALPIGIDLVG